MYIYAVIKLDTIKTNIIFSVIDFNLMAVWIAANFGRNPSKGGIPTIDRIATTIAFENAFWFMVFIFSCLAIEIRFWVRMKYTIM